MDTKNFIISLLLMWSFAVHAAESNTSTVIDLSKVMQVEQLLETVEDRQVIFVSETHTRYDHHLNQLAIIDHQHQTHDKLAIGLEFIQQPFQQVLDDYVAGRIDEEAMLQGTDYFERWRYDYRLYRPIFHYAREHGLPLIALNIDRDITDQVSSVGLENLSAEQKQQLPASIDRDNQDYRQRIREAFDQHPSTESRDFERFLDVQLLWDESMAARAAAWFDENPDGNMVILAGSGHIAYGSGIPQRLLRRKPLTSASVINLDEESTISAGMGDYLILSELRELPPAGLLGVLLDTTSPRRKLSISHPTVTHQPLVSRRKTVFCASTVVTSRAISTYVWP